MFEDSFAAWQSSPEVRLPWHAGAGVQWNEALGLLKDVLSEGARVAARSRVLSLAPEGALALHGRSLGWPRAPGEGVEEYRARLMRSWHYAKWRGTAKGIRDPLVDILTALLPAGVTPPNNWVEVLRADEPGWGRHSTDPDGYQHAARWFNVVIRQPHPFGVDFGFRWDDGTTYDSGKRYDVSGDGRLVDVIQQVVRRQKSAHSHCEWIAVVLAGNIIHQGIEEDGNPNGLTARVAYLNI